jgi:hydroxymethylpyrimidine/phosphomethylpyrimidine kinase
MTAIALTIAGSDSGGGAGIQADLKTFSALGVYGASVITALTAQNTVGVQGIHDVPPEFIAQQMTSVFSDLAVNAVKIGMLSQPAVISAVAEALSRHANCPIVLDPVMVAASGDRLLNPVAIAALLSELVPMATVITPNLPEAAALLGLAVADSEDVMQRQGEDLLSRGAKAVLMKGGHGSGPESIDLLVTPSGVQRFSHRRIVSRNSHGTGCTLSSAITAEMAKGAALADAVARAKVYISAAIEASDQLSIGRGHGPVHHFHRWWTA